MVSQTGANGARADRDGVAPRGGGATALHLPLAERTGSRVGVAIHAAGDGSHAEWPWYAKEIIRSQFTMHTMWPQFQINC